MKLKILLITMGYTILLILGVEICPETVTLNLPYAMTLPPFFLKQFPVPYVVVTSNHKIIFTAIL